MSSLKDPKGIACALVVVVGALVPNGGFGQRRVTSASTLFTVPGYCAGPQWQPHGDRIVCSSGNATGWSLEIRAASGAPVGTIPGVQVTWAWSPDGQKIAAIVPAANFQSNVVIFDANGASSRTLTSTPETMRLSVAWSADSGQVFYTRLVDRARREEVVAMPTGGGSPQLLTYGQPVYSPDGRTFAYRRVTGLNNEIVLRTSGATSERVVGQFAGSAASHGPTWSPDGRRLAVGGILASGVSGHIAVLDTSDPTATFREFSDVTGDSFAWSPDSTEIVTSSFDGPAPPVARIPSGAPPVRRMKLVAVNVATDQRRVLARADRGACRVWQPAWSTTGLAFVHQCRLPLPTETRVIRLP